MHVNDHKIRDKTLCVSGIYDCKIKIKVLHSDSRGCCLTKTEFLHCVLLNGPWDRPTLLVYVESSLKSLWRQCFKRFNIN